MAGSTWSLSSDFSLIHNPSSVWSYGSKPAGFQTTGMFSLFTTLALAPNGTGIVAWFPGGNSFGDSWLGVYYNPNPTEAILDLDGNGKTIPAKSVCMHPSEVFSFSVVRFTAPTNGYYSLDVTFTHIDVKAIDRHTGVYIVYNNLMVLWETDLIGIGDSNSFKSVDSGVAVKANETIDFIVGSGLDGLFLNDMTLANVDIRLLVATSTTGILPTNTNPTNEILSTNTDSTNGNLIPIIIGSFGASLSLVIAVILIYVYYRHRKNKEYQQRNPVTSRTDNEIITSGS
ncbi:hypothetical protein Glove_198g30 [Diversispora epigaea]|uniref:Uncharacterized protein n=1 Tax=Diversispora epigaea TaxID=1348612 RepID=A0A397INJ9_9GLOM|nr:hypothetical protein Glove_198g30 [Diversispora epigaea]